ncbi:MAG: hypothetical protein AAF865_08240 [Pseudomonadota bacterium]
MAEDIFASLARTPDMPATTVTEIVPDDGADLVDVTLALNVATPGNVRVTTLSGDVADVHVAAGVAFPLRVVRVWATGTTATGIRGLL